MNEYRQLRKIFDSAVGEPPRQVTVASVRRRARRYRTTRALAAAGAVTAVACLGAAAVAFATGAGRAGPVGGGRGAQGGGIVRVPAFYIQQSPDARDRTYVDPGVRSTATGAITDTLRCPGRGYFPLPTDLAAGGGQTFFMTCGLVNTKTGSVADTTRIYRFRISAAGRVSRPVLLASGSYGELAAADGGGSLAAVTGDISANGEMGPPGITLLSARTGRKLGYVRNNLYQAGDRLGISALSLSADGRELAFFAGCVTPGAGCTYGTEHFLRLPAGGPDPSAASSTVLPGAGWLTTIKVTFLDSQLSPDGSTLDIAYIRWHVHGDVYLVVAQRSVRTGRLIRYLYLHNAGRGISIGFASFDPSGRYPILDAGSGNAYNGWIDHGRFVLLDPAFGAGLQDEVW
jgi:hypothetical protein